MKRTLLTFPIALALSSMGPFTVSINAIRFQNGDGSKALNGATGGGAIQDEGTTTLNLQNDDCRSNTSPTFGGAVHEFNINFLPGTHFASTPASNYAVGGRRWQMLRTRPR